MEVIKPGNGQKEWSEEFTCTGKGNGGGGCGALLRVVQSDLFITASGHYDGSTDYYTTFKCSECSVLTDITTKHKFNRALPNKRAWEALQKQKEKIIDPINCDPLF